MVQAWLANAASFSVCLLATSLFSQDAIQPLTYSNATLTSPPPFLWTDLDHPCITRFADESGVHEALEGDESEFEKIADVATWLLSIWKPSSGEGEVDLTDPVGLLEKARNGKCPSWCFRAVLRAALAAVGIHSRAIAMHVADVETRLSGATALGLEAYLPDVEKWIFVDTDYRLIALVDDEPVNCVEFQRALITESERVTAIDVEHTGALLESDSERLKTYIAEILPYLHYIGCPLDQRIHTPTIYSALKILLTPLGAKRPVRYQVDKGSFSNTLFFDTLAAFYFAPDISLSERLQNPTYLTTTDPPPRPLVLNQRDDAYMIRFREAFGIDALVTGRETPLQKATALCKWAHSRWAHNGDNVPSKPDPISILEDAKNGSQFRCVEYATILSAALVAVDVPARSVNLQTANAEIEESGAAHQVVEAYAADLDKWFMLDGQWGVIPTMDGVPLNAVEFKSALRSARDKIELIHFDLPKRAQYMDWIEPYLYFLSYHLDQRFDVEQDFQRPSLMLVPEDASAPKVFQRRFPVSKNRLTTHSLTEFYSKP